MYWLSWHCFVPWYIWSDCRTNWTIARIHSVAPWVICKMEVTFGQMGEAGWITQNEKCAIWPVTTVWWPTGGVAADSWLVQYTSYLTNVNVPERFLGSLYIAAVMINVMISRENNVRRLRMMSLDRLYIAHTRRIIMTAVTIWVTFSQSETITHNRPHQEREGMPIHSLRRSSYLESTHSGPWIY